MLAECEIQNQSLHVYRLVIIESSAETNADNHAVKKLSSLTPQQFKFYTLTIQ